MQFRTIIVILIITCLCCVYGCNEDTSTPTQNRVSPDTTLAEYVGAGFISTAPNNWFETYPGAFKRNNSDNDYTILIQRFYPDIDLAWFINSSKSAGPYSTNTLNNVDSIITTEYTEWNIYSSEETVGSTLMATDWAISERESGCYVVVLMSTRAEHNQNYDEVFIPVISSYQPDIPQEQPVVNTSIFDYDNSLPLDIIQQNESVDAANITEINLTFESAKSGRVPTTLLIPPGDGPFPGMIVQHGFPSNRHQIKSLGLRYARKGVAIVLIDAPWARPEHSGRDYPLTFTSTDSSEQVQLMVDLKRSFDVLIDQANIIEDQLAYVGVSYGGAMGGLLAAVEPRLKAVVLVIGDGGLIDHFFGLEELLLSQHTWADVYEQKGWIESMMPVEPITWVVHASHVPLLFQNGVFDVAVPAPDAKRYQSAASNPKTIKWYNAGHALPDELLTDQENWLSQFLSFTQ